MATQRIKLDYNHLMEQIDGFLSDKSEENDTLVLGIAMGLDFLGAYIKNIAERAIELNDEVLIDLLKDLCILKEKER
jgi:hypothetical protein